MQDKTLVLRQSERGRGHRGTGGPAVLDPLQDPRTTAEGGERRGGECEPDGPDRDEGCSVH